MKGDPIIIPRIYYFISIHQLPRHNISFIIPFNKETFKQKIKAIREHESQWMALATMIPAVYIRGLLNGLDKGVKYAEVFVKLR